MNVLLDECLPRKLKYDLPGHTVSTVPEMGWAGTKNGALLRLAETTFEVFITADQNVEYQQNLRSTVLGIVVLVASDKMYPNAYHYRCRSSHTRLAHFSAPQSGMSSAGMHPGLDDRTTPPGRFDCDSIDPALLL